MDDFTDLRNRQSSSLDFLRSDFVFIFLAPVFENMLLFYFSLFLRTSYMVIFMFVVRIPTFRGVGCG